MVAGWPVQSLPVYNALTDEALTEAVEVEFGLVQTRVLSAEHLAAIMLETGRPKDHARLIQFIEFDVLDRERLADNVTRHGLTAKRENFRIRFLSQNL